MRCLVTAVKHVNNARAIVGQLLGKEVPAETNMHATIELPFLYDEINTPLLQEVLLETLRRTDWR
jgi:hypothetical protein